MTFPLKTQYDAISLKASSVVTAAGTVNGAAILLQQNTRGFIFVLDVTAAAAAVGDTLDVKIQTKLDGPNGATWTDVVHFTQILGNGGAKRFFAKVVGAPSAEAMFEDHANALAAGSIKNLFGDQFRYTSTVVDGGAHGQSFTFSVTAIPF